MTNTHTQTTISVYATYKEKKLIKEYCESINKSMSAYILKLILDEIEMKTFLDEFRTSEIKELDHRK